MKRSHVNEVCIIVRWHSTGISGDSTRGRGTCSLSHPTSSVFMA